MSEITIDFSKIIELGNKVKNYLPHKKEITLPGSGALSLFFNETQSKLTKPYTQLPAVYSCIRAKSRNISQVPFEIFKGDNDKPDTRGAMVELWKGDNNTPQITLFEGMVTYLNPLSKRYLASFPVSVSANTISKTSAFFSILPSTALPIGKL